MTTIRTILRHVFNNLISNKYKFLIRLLLSKTLTAMNSIDITQFRYQEKIGCDKKNFYTHFSQTINPFYTDLKKHALLQVTLIQY